MTFTSTLDSQASEDNTLTIDGAGGGAITFTGAVGGAADGELGAILISTATTVLASSTIEAASLVQSAGTLTTLTDNVTTTAVAGVDITATDIRLDGLTINTNAGNGVARFAGAVRIDAATTITRGSGAVTFTSTLDSQASEALTIDGAGGGAITFSGAVGATTALASLTASGTTISLQSVTTKNVTTTAAQVYTGTVTFNSDYVTNGSNFTVTGDVSVGSASTVSTTGGAISISGKLTSSVSITLDAGSSSVSVNEVVIGPTAGAVLFLDGDPFGTLKIGGTGGVRIDGGGTVEGNTNNARAAQLIQLIGSGSGTFFVNFPLSAEGTSLAQLTKQIAAAAAAVQGFVANVPGAGEELSGPAQALSIAFDPQVTALVPDPFGIDYSVVDASGGSEEAYQASPYVSGDFWSQILEEEEE